MRFPLNQVLSIVGLTALILLLNAAMVALDTGPGANPLLHEWMFQLQLVGIIGLGVIAVPALCLAAMLRDEDEEEYVHGYACWLLGSCITFMLLLVFAGQSFWYPLPSPTSDNFWLPAVWFAIAMLPLLALHGGIAIIRELKLRLMARHPGYLP